MQSLIRSKSAGVTGGRGTAGAGPGRDLLYAKVRHWLTIFDVPAVICSDRGSQTVGTWFKTMCKHMGIRHAKTVAYHSRSNGWAEVAGRQMFEKLCQLHIDEPGRNWYNSLWRVLQAYHDLRRPTVLSPHRILFLPPPHFLPLPTPFHTRIPRPPPLNPFSPPHAGGRIQFSSIFRSSCSLGADLPYAGSFPTLHRTHYIALSADIPCVP